MTDWKEKTMAHWGLINQLATRRFTKQSYAEEAALFVIEALEKDNWKRLQTFKEKSSFRTFLASLTHRLLEDFSRKKFGRNRPPLWIRNLGGFWLLLYRLLCLERKSLTEAVQAIVNRTQLVQRVIEDAAQRIKEEITNCGSHQAQEVSFDEAYHISRETEKLPHEIMEKRETELFFSALFETCIESSNKMGQSASKILFEGITLQPEERLLLKLCYQDGINVTQAGKLIGLNRHQVHGRLRRLLARLRSDFEKIGIDPELRQLLTS